jgi:Tfp pilus assembly protein PilO
VTQRDRIVLGVLATVAVIAGFWFLLLAPKREEASKAAAQVTEAQTRVDAAQAELNAGQAARRDYNVQVMTIARLGKAVPPTDDTPSLIFQLERTARAAGVDFRKFEIEAKAPTTGGAGAQAADGVTPMPFKVTFNGQFAELRRFLDELQDFAKPKGDTLDVKGRLLTVDGVSMAPKTDISSLVGVNLLITAYTAPVAGAKGTNATPQGTNATPQGTNATPQGTNATPPGTGSTPSTPSTPSPSGSTAPAS